MQVERDYVINTGPLDEIGYEPAHHRCAPTASFVAPSIAEIRRNPRNTRRGRAPARIRNAKNLDPEVECRPWSEQLSLDDSAYREQLVYLFERSRFYRAKLTAAGFRSAQAAGSLGDIAAQVDQQKQSGNTDSRLQALSLLFIIGLELNLSTIRKYRRMVPAISLGALALPLTMTASPQAPSRSITGDLFTLI